MFVYSALEMVTVINSDLTREARPAPWQLYDGTPRRSLSQRVASWLMRWDRGHAA